MSEPQIPKSLSTPPGGAHWSAPAPGQFAGMVQGMPCQCGGQSASASQVWRQPSPYTAARPVPQLSRHARVCLVILAVARLIILINRFVSSALSGYFIEIMAQWGTWLWTVFDILVIVLALLALIRQSNPIRFVTAGFTLFMLLFVAPMILEIASGNWYAAFVSPLFMTDSDILASLGFLMVARFLVIWMIGWGGTIAAFVLAIPDRKASTEAQSGS